MTHLLLHQTTKLGVFGTGCRPCWKPMAWITNDRRVTARENRSHQHRRERAGPCRSFLAGSPAGTTAINFARVRPALYPVADAVWLGQSYRAAFRCWRV